jgi:adenosine 3'-phospho 5'-phosphosulfate transporter B2
MIYGVLQERIMTQPYGEGADREFFKFTLFLVLMNRIVTCSVAAGTLAAQRQWDQFRPVAPLWAYAAVSISNVVATTCQYEALKYVSFPVQTLGKCSKMVPVMIWGILILRKKYTWRDYGMAVAVAAGCTLFLLTGDLSSKPAKQNAAMSASLSNLVGMLLMAAYLGFDGFTSTFQEKLFKGHQMSMQNQIMFVTAFSALFSTFGLVSSGQLFQALSFVSRHPSGLGGMVALSLSTTVGQFFISYTIKNFGALVFATIMTTRQFLSILLSTVLFLHPLSLGQWAGTGVVFGTLYYKVFAGKKGGTSATTPPSPGKEGLPVSVRGRSVQMPDLGAESKG